MGRAPCCDKAKVKKGPWSPEEDAKLKEYIQKHGTGGNWISLPQKADLRRCGKSCRLRWLNYLRPNIKHGEFTDDEDSIICSLFASIGSRWSIIAAQLPGRTDNDIKNYWNTKLKKKLLGISKNSIPQKYPSISSSTPQSAQIPAPYDRYRYRNCRSTNSNIMSFSSGFEDMSPSFTAAVSSNSAHLIRAQDHELFSLLHSHDYNNTLLFGGEGSSSSCDHAFRDGEILISNNEGLNVGNLEKAEDGCFGENPLDYSIEEIKQLISTNTNICNNNLNFLVDHVSY